MLPLHRSNTGTSERRRRQSKCGFALRRTAAEHGKHVSNADRRGSNTVAMVVQ